MGQCVRSKSETRTIGLLSPLVADKQGVRIMAEFVGVEEL